MSSSVLASPEVRVVPDELDAGLFANPLGDFGEDRLQVRWLFRPTVDDGEVEVLGESVRLVVALA